jgi:hypothetical protein
LARFVNESANRQAVERRRKIEFEEKVQSSVTAVTEQLLEVGDTPVVNIVRRACKKAFFELGDTRQQWKGEAAASFVLGITSSRTLPTSSVGYWSP